MMVRLCATGRHPSVQGRKQQQPRRQFPEDEKGFSRKSRTSFDVVENRPQSMLAHATLACSACPRQRPPLAVAATEYRLPVRCSGMPILFPFVQWPWQRPVAGTVADPIPLVFQ